MDFDQLGHVGDQPGLAVQPPQDRFGGFGAFLLVPVEMPDALRIDGAAGRFFRIVQQGGPAQYRLRRDIFQDGEGMLPDVPVVVGVILRKAHHR